MTTNLAKCKIVTNCLDSVLQQLMYRDCIMYRYLKTGLEQTKYNFFFFQNKGLLYEKLKGGPKRRKRVCYTYKYN